MTTTSSASAPPLACAEASPIAASPSSSSASPSSNWTAPPTKVHVLLDLSLPNLKTAMLAEVEVARTASVVELKMEIEDMFSESPDDGGCFISWYSSIRLSPDELSKKRERNTPN
ncbi:hypothetical protein C4D60_Mb03t12390 [Musa balbisiana]|uniref:Uncharacterized protein n=1 Tax=Musa balbisiana TaxID=52838 RepID=A0A4S8J9E5_MUSBA|nr:hypothetical protein C4D60_Mb03t12390 [Musa balbisiana]